MGRISRRYNLFHLLLNLAARDEDAVMAAAAAEADVGPQPHEPPVAAAAGMRAAQAYHITKT